MKEIRKRSRRKGYKKERNRVAEEEEERPEESMRLKEEEKLEKDRMKSFPDHNRHILVRVPKL